MAKSVGETLRSMREEANLSRSALARRAKMEPGDLLRVETGGKPSFEMVAKIAAALNVSLDELAAHVFGRGMKPKAEASAVHAAEGLDRLEALLRNGSEVVEAMRAGRPVSPPRKRR